MAATEACGMSIKIQGYKFSLGFTVNLKMDPALICLWFP